MQNIFLSHSSKDTILVEKLNNFLISIGVRSDNIFCSSINGQGVENGKSISESIHKEIKNSKLIIFVITQNFLKSPYCTSELGAGWVLNGDKSSIYIFKSFDVEVDELNGFVDSNYKYSLFDSNGLSELCDIVSDIFEITPKHSVVAKNTKIFLDEIKSVTHSLVENKHKDIEQLEKENIKKLESQYSNLSLGAKNLIAEMYFSSDRIGYYTLSNGLVGSLVNSSFLYRTTSVSTISLRFAYAIQPWVIDYILKNKKVLNELKKLVDDAKKTKPSDQYFLQ